jgi:3-keto-disaccharide hydrolase
MTSLLHAPFVAVLLFLAAAMPAARAQPWQDLLANGLNDWEVVGNGIWKLRSDGVVMAYARFDTKYLANLGDRLTYKQFQDWLTEQSWLYTKREYEDFDFEIDYWVRAPGNSGISIRDASRGKYAVTRPPDYERTPAHIGYEIQITGSGPSRDPTGSLYTLVTAPDGIQKDAEWNTLHIESRKDKIRVLLNGQPTAEHPGVAGRATKGPIGLQLHDQYNIVMFRNIRIRER